MISSQTINIGFTPSDLLPGSEAYEFIITNPHHRKSPRDPKLRQTILALIYEFFRNRSAIMLFAAELPDEYGISNYVALILRPDHPRFAAIAQQFSDTIELFREKPE